MIERGRESKEKRERDRYKYGTAFTKKQPSWQVVTERVTRDRKKETERDAETMKSTDLDLEEGLLVSTHVVDELLQVQHQDIQRVPWTKIRINVKQTYDFFLLFGKGFRDRKTSKIRKGSNRWKVHYINKCVTNTATPKNITWIIQSIKDCFVICILL